MAKQISVILKCITIRFQISKKQKLFLVKCLNNSNLTIGVMPVIYFQFASDHDEGRKCFI